MPTIDDVLPFLPFFVIALCLLIGKAISGSTKLPNWIIPPVLAGTGALAGAAEAVLGGAPWKQALLTACGGLIAVGLHQTGRSAARQDTSAPKPDAPKPLEPVHVVIIPPPAPSVAPVVVPSDPNASSR